MLFISVTNASKMCPPSKKMSDLVENGSMNFVAAKEIFWQVKGLMSQNVILSCRSDKSRNKGT